MVNNYRNLPIYSLGFSDVGHLVMRGYRLLEQGEVLERLDFGGDGEYFARIGSVDNPCLPPYDGCFCTTVYDKAPKHYELVAEFNLELDIFDDQMRTVSIKGTNIYVYRAGDYGCLILVDGAVPAHEVHKYGGILEESIDEL